MKPFSISPNPACLYLTSSLKAVIAKVSYTIEERQGLTCILGDVGMGKSSVLRLLHSDYSARPDITCCLIPNPSFVTDFAFLKGICSELGVSAKRSLFDQEEALKRFLVEHYANNRNVVVFIDEAQKLNGKMLERTRALLNFETSEDKLIQIIFSGQLELRDRLRDPSKKAIRSRIFAPSILSPLTFEETVMMIDFRCNFFNITNPFSSEAVEIIYNNTSGVPREVLKICAIAYAIAQAKDEPKVSLGTMQEAVTEAVM